ncbi:hypothetical protein [Spongiactinospora sp. TRM90649]|nr:hypothetical protein [Spongiactinospora sp. TRM90649]MDF5752143.1 hypothetical protein [Spongiactinospora sp. TRM90649]
MTCSLTNSHHPDDSPLRHRSAHVTRMPPVIVVHFATATDL